MATEREISYKNKRKLEAQAVKESTEKYDDLIATFILIAQSNLSKADKIKKVNTEIVKLQKFNTKFADSFIEDGYSTYAAETAKQIDVKKKLSPAQIKEMENLQAQLKNELNKRLMIYADNAKKLILKEELKKLREASLGYTDATQRRLISDNKFKKDILFMDSRGRRISNKAIMSITVGDSVWDSIYAGIASTAILNEVNFGIHVSVIDERTTEICIDLDGQKRDLRTDDLPPLHVHCRSDIVLIINE